MKRNVTVAIAALVMMAMGAGGMYVLYKGYKKYKAEKTKEFRYESKMGQISGNFDAEAFKKEILSDDILDEVIKEQNLVDSWDLDEAVLAKQRIREKFIVKLENNTVKASFQDPNKDICHNVLKSILEKFSMKVRAARR